MGDVIYGQSLPPILFNVYVSGVGTFFLSVFEGLLSSPRGAIITGRKSRTLKIVLVPYLLRQNVPLLEKSNVI